MRQEFAVHMLNDEGKKKATIIARKFHEVLCSVEALCDTPEGHRGPGGREMAIVRTKLEEACFFAKKAMASQPGNVAT